MSSAYTQALNNVGKRNYQSRIHGLEQFRMILIDALKMFTSYLLKEFAKAYMSSKQSDRNLIA
jgi:hypothetical protein